MCRTPEVDTERPYEMSALEELRVLVADDNQRMRAIITAVLNSLGVTAVQEAQDGAEALSVLYDWQPDVAIVDFRMEPLDGVAFTRLVRNDPRSKNPFLPIIMLTGHADRARVTEARDAGVNEIIVKPITAAALVVRLQSVIFHPRPFIRTDTYFGPDRRRTGVSEYAGPERRKTGQAPRLG